MIAKVEPPAGMKQGNLGEMKVTIFRLLSYLTVYRFRLSCAIILMIGFACAMGILPTLMGAATDIIAGKGSLEELQHILIFFVLDAAAVWICGHIAQRLLSDISQDALFHLRDDLFTHMQTLSLGFFDRQPIGELMSRLSNDTDVIDQFFSNGIQQVLQSVTTVIVLTVIMVFINPFMTLLVYLAVIGLIWISGAIARISGPAFEHMQDQLGELNGYAEERLAGQKVTIAYRQEESSTIGFLSLSEHVARIGGKAEFVALTSMPATTIIANLQMILLLVVGGAMVIDGDIKLGEMVAFLGLSSSISSPLSQIFSEYALIMNAIAGASRVFRILDEKPVVAGLILPVTVPERSSPVTSNLLILIVPEINLEFSEFWMRNRLLLIIRMQNLCPRLPETWFFRMLILPMFQAEQSYGITVFMPCRVRFSGCAVRLVQGRVPLSTS